MESALYGIYALIAEVSEIERVKAARSFSVSLRFAVFFFFFQLPSSFLKKVNIISVEYLKLNTTWHRIG